MNKSGMEEDFFSFYEKETDALFRFILLKISDREHAKDIVQEAFVRVWEYLSAGKLIENKRAFVFRVAANIVVDHYRKKKEQSLDQLHEAGFDVSDHRNVNMADKFDTDVALDILRGLPDKQREAVWLRTVEGWSVKDIAAHLEEDENTVSVRIHRGLKIWKERCAEISKKYPGKTS